MMEKQSKATMLLYFKVYFPKPPVCLKTFIILVPVLNDGFPFVNHVEKVLLLLPYNNIRKKEQQDT